MVTKRYNNIFIKKGPQKSGQYEETKRLAIIALIGIASLRHVMLNR